jgi:Zn-dependent protease
VAWLLHSSGVVGVVVAALAWLGGINILLAVFNVIPTTLLVRRFLVPSIHCAALSISRQQVSQVNFRDLVCW